MPMKLPYAPQPEIRNDPTELRLLYKVSQTVDEGIFSSAQLLRLLELVAKYTGMMQGHLALQPKRSDAPSVSAFAGVDTQPKEAELSALVTAVKAQAAPLVSVRGSGEYLLTDSYFHPSLKESLSFIAVPILAQQHAVGGLIVDRVYADSVPLEEDIRLLRVIASIIARAVQVLQGFSDLHSAVIEENRRLHTLLHSNFDVGGAVVSSGSMRTVLEEIQQVTDSNATVLIRGESGTGKELVADLIHANSQRSGKPFVAVNCAAMPEGLVESELFGHERGAFTGAVSARKGRFEMAHSGSIFLDEVGDMPLAVQAKLLRTLQQREFERVGGAVTLRTDVRVIAATNRNLEQMVAEGTFRQDLYYRLSVFPIMLPPLRERKDDIMPLVTHFIDKFSVEFHRKVVRISSEATAMLMAYHWPGNIRELENVIQRAVVLCGRTGTIDIGHLPASLQPESIPVQQTLSQALANLERRYLVQALEEAGGNQLKAAERLGITERIMGLRMKKYRLHFADFRAKNI